MTMGHLLYATVLTVYMGVATLVEERDLLAHFGEQYANYRRTVPRFIPRVRTTASRELPRSESLEALDSIRRG
jgi:steroid 5-alpha reductase family enzyme